LALELAAARLSVLSAAERAARLDRRLSVLVGAPRDAPVRQRTLRATIDWSYGLLDEDERRAFAHSAVFAAGATVAAVGGHHRRIPRGFGIAGGQATAPSAPPVGCTCLRRSGSMRSSGLR
jgi:hypothetical protein